ncbi:hypothetical protein CRUP_015163, partial [Coryphaenoides rupestris]
MHLLDATANYIRQLENKVRILEEDHQQMLSQDEPFKGGVNNTDLESRTEQRYETKGHAFSSDNTGSAGCTSHMLRAAARGCGGRGGAGRGGEGRNEPARRRGAGGGGVRSAAAEGGVAKAGRRRRIQALCPTAALRQPLQGPQVAALRGW